MLAKNIEIPNNKTNRTSKIKSKKRHHNKNYFNSSSKKYQLEEKDITSPQKLININIPKGKESPEHDDEYRGLKCQYLIPNPNTKENICYYNLKEKDEYNNFKKKWKTEICRNWEMYGQCKYGNNCAFPQGDTELKKRKLSFNYKTKACKQFFELGYCPYGIRCQFSHKKDDFLRERQEIGNINGQYDENKISYLKIIKEFLSEDNNNISLELVKRPRLKTFENITRSSLQERENSKLKLYEDIINLKNDMMNNNNDNCKEKHLRMKFSEDSYYTNFSSDNNENNNDL